MSERTPIVQRPNTQTNIKWSERPIADGQVIFEEVWVLFSQKSVIKIIIDLLYEKDFKSIKR